MRKIYNALSRHLFFSNSFSEDPLPALLIFAVMISPATFKKLALSYTETSEDKHHEVVSFKVKGKIFATLNAPFHRACVRLNPIDQDVFCAYDPDVMYRVPNAWAKYGWTNINLKKIRKEMLQDALTSAYCTVAPAVLAEKYRHETDY